MFNNFLLQLIEIGSTSCYFTTSKTKETRKPEELKYQLNIILKLLEIFHSKKKKKKKKKLSTDYKYWQK